MWIKICGTTSLDDAQLAVDLGADALGFIFAPSKRRVSVAEVAAIVRQLPSEVERVGVFQGQGAAEIAVAVRQAELTAVQIHDAPPTGGGASTLADGNGGVSESLISEVRALLGDRVPIIQAVHYAVRPRQAGEGTTGEGRGELSAEAEVLRERIAGIARTGTAQRVLVDSRVGSSSGGTGVAFDWAEARGALSGIPDGLRFILAGGLTPANVSNAIETLRPWGVDVVSGVEAWPGRKEAGKLGEFMRRARA